MFDRCLIVINKSDQPMTIAWPSTAGSATSVDIYTAPITAIIAGMDTVEHAKPRVKSGEPFKLPPHSVAVTNW